MRKCENRKLKGSVLLTVVAVMSILVVFLFGTLALALAANNRAHVNYSSAQTSITARTVAESVVRSINENPTKDGAAFANLIGEVVEGSDPVSVAVSINGDGTNTLGRIDPVTVSYAGTKKYYNVSKNEWEDRDLLKFTATVNMSGVTSTASVYALKYKRGDTPSTSGGGAGFVTTAGTDVRCQTSIFGGAYIKIPTKDNASNYAYNDEKNKRSDFIDATKKTLLCNSDAVIEADFCVNDNLYVENWSGFVFPRQGTGVVVMGDMEWSSNATDHLGYIYNGAKDNIAFNKVPFLYVDGVIKASQNGVIAIGNNEEKFPFNTFCGTFEKTEGMNQYTLVTNIYCMDSNGSSTIANTNQGSKLQKWTGSVINKTKPGNEKVQGEVCSNGNLTLENCTIDGNVRVRGNLTLKGKVTIKGYIACGGTINTNELNELSGCTDIYNDKMGGTGDSAGNLTLPNYVMYYYVCNPSVDLKDTAPKYVEPFIRPGASEPQPLSDGEYFIDGELQKPEVNPLELQIVYTLNYDYHFKKDTGAVNNIDYYIIDESYNADYYNYDWEAHDYYGEDKVYYGYVQSKCDKPNGNGGGFKGTTFNIEEFSCSIDTEKNKNEFTVQVDGRYFVVEFNPEAKTNQRTFTIESKKASNGGGSGNTIKGIAVKNLNEFYKNTGETSVYPEYARRPVIFGVEELDGIDKIDTQVLKTMSEITDKVNPYDYDTLPGGLQSIYDSATEYDKIESMNELLKAKRPDKNKFDYTTVKNDGDTYYIDKSCILNINDSVGKDIIINPNGSEMVIGIKKLSIQSGKDILIDDSNGGNVYFYIEKDGYFELNGSRILTKTYWNLICVDGGKLSVGSDKYTNITDKVPNAYLYGAGNSNFKVSNTHDMSLNIISPNIICEIAAGESLVTACNYDGYELTCGTNVAALIGCCNVSDASLHNKLNVIHIPSDGGPADDQNQFDRLYWYDTLYYSEF